MQAGAAGVFAGDYVTNPDGVLDLGGFDQTIANVANGGRVRLSGAPGTTLTIQDEYIGTGGIVELNTALGDDTSATDLLVVNGDTSGTSSLIVNNVGGAGAQTGATGIKVIDVGGASNGTFSLIGDYVFEGDQAVVGGAYAYRLYQGTETDADGDWYLRSEIIDAGPLYAPTVALYENYANVLQSFNELGTLRAARRQPGMAQWRAARGCRERCDRAGRDLGPAWMPRKPISEPDVSTTGADYDVTTWKLQAGMDGLLQQSEAGTLVARAECPVRHGQLGYRLDVWRRLDRCPGFWAGRHAHLVRGGRVLPRRTGPGDLVLGRYQFRRHRDHTGRGQWWLRLWRQPRSRPEDRARRQLVADPRRRNWPIRRSVSTSSPTSTDAIVSLDDGGDSLVGRLGVSADYEGEWQDAAGNTNRTHLYGVANLYYDFLDGSSVDVSGTTFTSENKGLWGGVGVGGSLSLADDQYSVFGEALVRGSLEDFGGNSAVGAKVGLNVKW